MPNKVKNYILIKYEDLSFNYTETLQKIKNKFNLNFKHATVIKINEYYVGGTAVKDKKSPEVYKLPDKFISNVYNGLNIETEIRIGYNHF